MEHYDFHPHPPASDAAPEKRPGVPMEKSPEPLRGAEAALSARQESDVELLLHAERKDRPIVYGTAQPPTGLSGSLRRLAYRYPDHRTRKWMLLMLADQVAAKGAWIRRHARVSAAGLTAGLLFAGVVSRADR